MQELQQQQQQLDLARPVHARVVVPVMACAQGLLVHALALLRTCIGSSRITALQQQGLRFQGCCQRCFQVRLCACCVSDAVQILSV
jgi:hypothetical protein